MIRRGNRTPLGPREPDTIESVTTEHAERVSHLVREIESRVLVLAGRVGASFDFSLSHPTNDVAEPDPGAASSVQADPGAVAAFQLIEFFANGLEQVSVSRTHGEWGLWYQKNAWGAPPKRTLLRDAPLEARERFLRHSTRFVKEYAEKHRERLQELENSLAVGAAGVSELDRLLSRSGGA